MPQWTLCSYSLSDCVYLTKWLSNWLSHCLSHYVTECQTVSLSVSLSVRLSVWPSVWLAVCLTGCLAVWLIVCLSNCLTFGCLSDILTQSDSLSSCLSVWRYVYILTNYLTDCFSVLQSACLPVYLSVWLTIRLQIIFNSFSTNF